MLVEVCLEVITQGFEALRAQSKEVPLVRVGDEPTGKLLIPARALDARQEPARNYREQLRREARHSQISKKKNKDHSVDWSLLLSLNLVKVKMLFTTHASLHILHWQTHFTTGELTDSHNCSWKYYLQHNCQNAAIADDLMTLHTQGNVQMYKSMRISMHSNISRQQFMGQLIATLYKLWLQ